MKYELGDKVITTKQITGVKGNLKIIDKNIKGIVVAIDGTAKTCQPYLVEFEKTMIEGCGKRLWAFGEEIAKY